MVSVVGLTLGSCAAETANVPQANDFQDGLYAGVGVSFSKAGIKTETTHAAVNGVELFNFEGVDSSDSEVMFLGTLALGYNQRLGNHLHLSLEGLLDIGPNSHYNHIGVQPFEDKVMNITSEQKGCIPSIGLRLGYVSPTTKDMVYLKAGAALAKVKTKYVDSVEYEVKTPTKVEYKFQPIYTSVQCSKISPLLAVGFEKSFKNLRGRFELEYRFEANKKRNYQGVSDSSKPGGIYEGTIKVSSKSAITLRVMGIYSF